MRVIPLLLQTSLPELPVPRDVWILLLWAHKQKLKGRVHVFSSISDCLNQMKGISKAVIEQLSCLALYNRDLPIYFA